MQPLSFEKTKKILSRYGVISCQEILAQSKKEVFSFAEKKGFPIVVKISSPKVSHITNIGGLVKNIKNKKDLEGAWDKIQKVIKKEGIKDDLEGILVQEQVKGIEVVVGMQRSQEFGPVIMFGLGGIFVEVLKDVSFGVCPLSRSEIMNMIKNIKAYKILKKFRGRPAVNFKKLIDLIHGVSQLSLENDSIQSIDLNPVMVNEKKALAVDTYILNEKTK